MSRLNVAAVRTLERLGHEDLRPMLGLVTEDGDIPPDDTNVYNFPTGDRPAPGAANPKSPLAANKDRSNVPEGLLNLPEPPEEPVKKRRGPKSKVIRPSKPREIPECGTYRAFTRHKRRGEPVDDACLEAGREYGRNYQAQRTARLKKEAEARRLAEAGVQSPEAIATLKELAR